MELRDGKIDRFAVISRLLKDWNMICPNEASVEQLILIFKELQFNEIALTLERKFHEELQKGTQESCKVSTSPNASNIMANNAVRVSAITPSSSSSTCRKSETCVRLILPFCIVSSVICASTFGLITLANGKDNHDSSNIIHLGDGKSNHSSEEDQNVKIGNINCDQISTTNLSANTATNQILSNETIAYLELFSRHEQIEIYNFSLCTLYCDLFVDSLKIEKLVTVIIKHIPDKSSFSCLEVLLKKHSSTIEAIDINAQDTIHNRVFEDGPVFSKAQKLIFRSSDVLDNSTISRIRDSAFSGEKLCEKFPRLENLIYERVINGTELLFTLTSCSHLRNLSLLVEINNLEGNFDINRILNDRTFDYVNLTYKFTNECPHLSWYRNLKDLERRCTVANFYFINCPTPNTDSLRKEKFVVHQKYGV